MGKAEAFLVDDKDHLALRKRERDIAAAVAPYVRPRLCAIATSHQQRSGLGATSASYLPGNFSGVLTRSVR